MNKRRLLLPAIFAALIAGGFVSLRREHATREATPSPAPMQPEPAAVAASITLQKHEPSDAVVANAPFGDRILAEYASASSPPEQDLEAVARTLGNLALLVKGDNPLPLGANEEIAAALRGKNRAKLAAVSEDNRIFNASGQIVDRWNTPLYFHAASRDRLEIRSAGPDRQMWTADDLHRLPDGRFTRGEALLPRSLFEEKSIAR